MGHYRAIVKNHLGNIEEFNIEADTIDQARVVARRNGSILEVKKGGGTRLFEICLLAEERQVLLHRLSSMLASKLGTSEALTVIVDSFSGRIKKFSNTLLKHMESGSDLVEAIEKVGPPHFPATTIALIKAGSKGGETWKAIRDAAEFEIEIKEVREGSGKGFLLGIIGFVFAAILTFGVKFYVAPKVLETQFFKMKEDSINLDFINVLSTCVTVSMGILFTIFVFLFLLGTVGRLFFPTQSDNLILKIPFYKDLILSKENYIVLYGLSVLINSGVSMEKSLELSADSTRKGALRDDLYNAMKAIKLGRPWAKTMRTFHATDKASLSVSSDHKQIALTLSTLSYQYREDYKRTVASFGPSMQLLSALFMVLAGGILFGYTILPMLQISAGGF